MTKSKRQAFEIAGTSINPGDSQTVELSLPSLYSHSQMPMAIHVVHGKQNGPCLMVSSAIHGDEINGIEIISRLLKRKALSKIKGTLIAVPVVNVYGFLNQSRYLPDRKDLNRFFPGSQKGSLTSRLANFFVEEVVNRCTHGIDLHTGALHRFNLPQIRASFKQEENRKLAQVFGAPVVLNSDVLNGSLREVFLKQQKPMIIYEGGEALKFDELAIKAAVHGILNVMRHLEMIPNIIRKSRSVDPFIAKTSRWLRASESGLFKSLVSLGQGVKKGEIVGHIYDPFLQNEIPIESYVDGLVIGQLNAPMVNEGDALLHIACSKDTEPFSELLETFHEEVDATTLSLYSHLNQ